MRTSFNKDFSKKEELKIPLKRVEEPAPRVDPDKELHDQIVSGYSSLKEAINNSVQNTNEKKGTEMNTKKDKQVTADVAKPRKPRKGLIIAIVAVSVVAVSATFFVKFGRGNSDIPVDPNPAVKVSEQKDPVKETTKPIEESIPMESQAPVSTGFAEYDFSSIESALNALYTDETKVDLKPDVSSLRLDPIFIDLKKAEDSGADVSKYMSEANEIRNYLNVRYKLELYEGEGYDVSTENIHKSLLEIKNSTNAFKNEGLKNTITSRCEFLLGEISEYNRINEILSTATDANSVDAETLSADIAKLYHEKSREKLTGMLNNLK